MTATFAPERLYILRCRAGLTGRDVAARIGHRQPAQLSRWERGLKVPTVDSLVKLADAIGCHPGDFFTTEPEPSP